MAYRVIRPATHEEWLDERKKGIGSSEAGTIMGVNKFDTPYSLWRRKTGVDGPIPQNEAMELGHHMEPAVVTMFAARTGAQVCRNSEGDWIAVDKKREYLRVSPDRLFYADGDKHTKRNLRILECKTTSVSVDPDDFPVYWYCQLQYQMGVMGVKKGAVAWISSYPRLNFGYKEFDFNPEFFKALVEQLEIFWLINVQGGIAPDDINSEDALVRNPTAKDGVTVQATLVQQTPAEESEVSSCELDSVLLAKALRHMAVIEGIELTQSQIQTILYIAYGVRLATKNERLTLEHPQMWQYGPVFPRAYNRLRKDDADGTDEYYSLKTGHPNIFKYLENCFRRYAWTKAYILSTPHLSEGTPWSEIRKSNPDRWGVRIEDDLIREWFLPRV